MTVRFNGSSPFNHISTHTPAWGVTDLTDSVRALSVISTHTPAWGVTSVNVRDCTLLVDFNSHARVGRDEDVRL